MLPPSAGILSGVTTWQGRDHVAVAGWQGSQFGVGAPPHVRRRPGFALIVHHTDAVREYAYDRDTKVGHLEKALVAAKAKGWTIANMKRDWKAIFPFDQIEDR